MHEIADASDPRFPELTVRVHSTNPLVLVAAVRYALWRAGVGHDLIDRFSQEALDQRTARAQRQICAHWVDVDQKPS